MTFNEVMALIMPSFIAVLFYSKLTNNSFKVFQNISYLAFFMVTTNCICYVILLLLKVEQVIFTIQFTVKYCLLAICIATVIVIVYRFIELNIKINFKVETVNEKEDE
ncbi:hypothetical protein E1I69_15345 [Bacillus timonensis]|uniref:Uncharacterized protein n=1 Tax=Bacillus timonensis TaxID=1033734 RepID=A0A4S3PQ50_9BACI|nr:hypothetical protein [Bacillus timonensis]THE11336.1 hypothetical protein E1I69_15345 [Bacillus timonensis]